MGLLPLNLLQVEDLPENTRRPIIRRKEVRNSKLRASMVEICVLK